jgi:hypothetical protein
MSMPESQVKSTAGNSSSQPEVDRSASGLAYQKYSMSLVATGAALGVGRRVAPDPSAQFRNPPMSGAQFGGGSNARSEMEGGM